MIAALVPVFLVLIFGIPTAAAIAPVILAGGNETARTLFIFLSPVIFSLSYVLVASTLSRIGRPAIIRGTFPRDLKHPVYGPRRLYALCWTAIYYFTPLYFVCLSLPLLKRALFRAFGYKGETDNTIFPDVWIRDLPLLKIGKKAYVANRASLGSNLCLIDGTTLVDWLWIGDGTMVGHMALFGPGTKAEDQAQLGINSIVGIRCRIRPNAKVGPRANINHGVEIGAGAEIGACAFVGLRAKIGEGVKIPDASNIPAGLQILTQEEADRLFQSESQMLEAVKKMGLQEMISPQKGGDPSNVVSLAKKANSETA